MRIVSKTDAFGYQLVCENCQTKFDSGRVGIAFECPGCGSSEMAADLVSDWTLRQPSLVSEAAG